jgi:ubiquinone/menaquinone biosynthesis C-methylase UbiE
VTIETAGSVDAFDANWRKREETARYHFKRGAPDNQVQFAFQNHWRVFRNILGPIKNGTALEVGCGRGSMGAFFADSGFETHLVDTSTAALGSARDNFRIDNLTASAICGDALNIPYADNSFDVVVSIGLLEHFEDIGTPVREQLRVLQPGGVMLGYVVPERPLSVQTLATPVNTGLRALHKLSRRNNGPAAAAKEPLYRNNYAARDYLKIADEFGVREAGSFGMFPVPLVSHSPAFPFSTMSPSAERRLIRLWRLLFSLKPGSGDPWICKEKFGLAFLVWARK